MRFRCVIAACIVLASTLCEAGTTGNELFELLRSPSVEDNLRGYAYIEGVLDTENEFLAVEVLRSVDFKSKKTIPFIFSHFCLSENGITFGQIKDIIYKYLDSHPEDRHNAAQGLIRIALLQRFACANNPQSGIAR